MKKHKLDFSILVPIFLLAIISIISIQSASIYTSKSLGNLVIKQTVWYFIGGIFVFIVLKYKNTFLYKNSWFLYIIGNILLLGLLLFGTPVNNSKCWLVIPGIGSIQPSEFMKVFIMLVLATMIHNFRSTYPNSSIKQEASFIVKTLIVILIPSILTFLQPDTGAVVIYFVIYFCMMFISGIRARWFILSTIVIVLIISSILALFFFKENSFIHIFGTSLYYRLDRIFDWKNGSGLQLENALAAIGSSGFLGHGFKNNPIYFPEAPTDFIFAIYASNFGFLGVLIFFLIIIYLDIQIINLCHKKYIGRDKYILVGIFGMLVFQQIQNIGMTIGLFPIMGITLPFISYGGSSLVSYMLLIGIILNISNKKNRKYNYK